MGLWKAALPWLCSGENGTRLCREAVPAHTCPPLRRSPAFIARIKGRLWWVFVCTVSIPLFTEETFRLLEFSLAIAGWMGCVWSESTESSPLGYMIFFLSVSLSKLSDVVLLRVLGIGKGEKHADTCRDRMVQKGRVTATQPPFPCFCLRPRGP